MNILPAGHVLLECVVGKLYKSEGESKIMLLDTLSEYNEVLIVIFSFVVAIATVAYVTLTRKLVLETIRMREAQT